MLSAKVKIAVSELTQVDALIEMVIRYITSEGYVSERDKEWYEKVESSLYLLGDTYKAKKENLMAALEGGDVRA